MNKQSQSKYKRNEKWADTAESIAALWAELKDGDYIEVRLVLVHNPVWMRRIRDQAASTPIEADGEQEVRIGDDDYGDCEYLITIKPDGTGKIGDEDISRKDLLALYNAIGESIEG